MRAAPCNARVSDETKFQELNKVTDDCIWEKEAAIKSINKLGSALDLVLVYNMGTFDSKSFGDHSIHKISSIQKVRVDMDFPKFVPVKI